MGLNVKSLAAIPDVEIGRDYFIYLLDFGWYEPLSEALKENFDRMAKIAEGSNAVVIKGNDKTHFEDEVLSWHNVNGEPAKEILPAILITNRHPQRLKERTFSVNKDNSIESDLKLILIPLKKFCKSTTEVADLIEKLFTDIKEGKDLIDFSIAQETSRDRKRSALADALILEPNFMGVGLRLNSIMGFLRGK